MTSSLHNFSCYRDSEGELVCSCVPILVQESPASERATGVEYAQQRAERDSATRRGIEYTPNRPRRSLLSQRGVGDVRFHRGIDR